MSLLPIKHPAYEKVVINGRILLDFDPRRPTQNIELELASEEPTTKGNQIYRRKNESNSKTTRK